MAILTCLLIFLAIYMLGARICDTIQPVYSSRAEAFVFQTGLGMVGISLITTLLAFGGLIYPLTGWVLLAVIYLTSWKRLVLLVTQIPHALNSLHQRKVNTDRTLAIVSVTALAILILSSLTLALAPPVRTDALVYHLAIPKAYLAHHGVVNLPNNMYSFFPLLFEMVFLFAMTFGEEALPALMGLGWAGVLLTALAVYYRDHLSGRRALWVPLVYFSTPTFWEIAASAYIDIALAGFVFLAFYAWDRWRLTRQTGWFLCLCLFGAAAWATKLTAFIILPMVVLGILLEERHNQRPLRVLGELFLFGGTVLLFMAPWWLRNYHYTGNPFVPLFMQFLGGSEGINWDSNRTALMDQYVKLFGMGRGPLELLLLPFNLTFRSAPHSLQFDGRVGIVFLMLLPALAGLWNSRSGSIRRMGAVFGVVMVFWLSYYQYVRFLAPAFTFLSILGVYGLERLTTPRTGTSRAPWQTAAWWLVAGGVLYNLTLVGSVWLDKNPMRYLTGKESRDQYLARNVPPYPMYRAMNLALDTNDKCLLIYMRNLGYLAERPFVSDSVFEAHTLQNLLGRDRSQEGIARQLKALGVTHLMYDENFVFGTDSAFNREEREALRRFLATRATLLTRKNGFFLYRFMLD